MNSTPDVSRFNGLSFSLLALKIYAFTDNEVRLLNPSYAGVTPAGCLGFLRSFRFSISTAREKPIAK